jgi:hypothetical protein
VSRSWVVGEAVLYRLHDVGYEIDLDRAGRLLASNVPARPRPKRGEAQALRIPNPPVTVQLAAEPWSSENPQHVEYSARLFDFGVVSLRARVRLPERVPWEEFVAWGTALGVDVLRPRFDALRNELCERVAPAIVRPETAPVAEDYVVFRVTRLEDESGAALRPDALDDGDVAALLVGESRALSPGALRDILSPRFAYFDDDLAVLTWNSALVVEPEEEDTDVQYVLEFANAQLLELRYYDSILDRELPRVYDGIAAARGGFHLLGRRYSRLLAALQTRVTDATEAVERTENALKVTDDVYLARIYAAALEIFRERTWRAGIDRKVAILGSAYEMLNAESQARRTEVLEIIIILLIALEIVLALRGVL